MNKTKDYAFRLQLRREICEAVLCCQMEKGAGLRKMLTVTSELNIGFYGAVTSKFVTMTQFCLSAKQT